MYVEIGVQCKSIAYYGMMPSYFFHFCARLWMCCVCLYVFFYWNSKRRSARAHARTHAEKQHTKLNCTEWCVCVSLWVCTCTCIHNGKRLSVLPWFFLSDYLAEKSLPAITTTVKNADRTQHQTNLSRSISFCFRCFLFSLSLTLFSLMQWLPDCLSVCTTWCDRTKYC